MTARGFFSHCFVIDDAHAPIQNEHIASMAVGSRKRLHAVGENQLPDRLKEGQFAGLPQSGLPVAGLTSPGTHRKSGFTLTGTIREHR